MFSTKAKQRKNTQLNVNCLFAVCLTFFKIINPLTEIKPGKKFESCLVKTYTSAFGRIQHGSLYRVPSYLIEGLLQGCGRNRDFLVFTHGLLGDDMR